MICQLREQLILQVAISLGRRRSSMGQDQLGSSVLSAYPSLALLPLGPPAPIPYLRSCKTPFALRVRNPFHILLPAQAFCLSLQLQV